MQSKHRSLFFSLAGILAALLLSAAISPVFGAGSSKPKLDAPQIFPLFVNTQQTSPCMSILLEAAGTAGVKGEMANKGDSDYGNGYYGCTLYYVISSENGSDATKTALSLSSSQPTIEASCEFTPLGNFSLTTFHGYNAQTYYQKEETRMVNEVPYTYERKDISWCMYKGDRSHNLSIMTDTQSIEKYGSAHDPLPIAEALWSIAEDRLPLSAVPENSAQQPALPVVPEEVVPVEPEVPTDSSTPVEPGGLFGIPLPILLGSLAVPVVGAIAGSILSSLLSLFGSSPISGDTNAAGIPPDGKPAGQELYWSERPWDEAGPGYVSKEEYEFTKDKLEKGYKWTNGGWQTPEQIIETNQWQQNNNAAVAKEDAELQAKTEAAQKALEQNKAKLNKSAEELQVESNMLDMNNDFLAINQELVTNNNYVLNPYQGDPTVAVYGLNALKNIVWDNTGGQLTGAHGLTCEGYVTTTSDKVIEVVSKRFPGATVESSKSWGNWFDSFIDDNHNLIKIRMPDESEWALDFHQFNAGNSPLLRPWPEARHAWKEDYMGDEFIERVRRSIKTEPKPRQ